MFNCITFSFIMTYFKFIMYIKVLYYLGVIIMTVNIKNIGRIY